MIAELEDGSQRERVQPYNWGSPQNPMSQADLEAKFRANSLPQDRSAEDRRRHSAPERAGERRRDQ
ncbi:MAG: hypothetical protein WDO24_21190 [Pseudomonadota bacterium]